MNAKNLIGGFITGAAIGVAAGLLLAPSSGEKTRRRLVKGSLKAKKDVIDYVESSIEGLRAQFNRKIDQVTGRAKETVNHGAERAEALTSKARNHG
jgi:gas vesicle protein